MNLFQPSISSTHFDILQGTARRLLVVAAAHLVLLLGAAAAAVATTTTLLPAVLPGVDRGTTMPRLAATERLRETRGVLASGCVASWHGFFLTALFDPMGCSMWRSQLSNED